MNITIATTVKDAGWFLERTLPCWEWADRIVAVDNGSSDGTLDLLHQYKAEVHHYDTPMKGNEWKVRKVLYELAMLRSDWVLWLDADQILASDPRKHLKEPAVRFRVFDMWSETTYRDDAWWKGHVKAWWWGLYAPAFEGLDAKWAERGWHSGHIPANIESLSYEMPLECSVLHYAYFTEELRAKKQALYAELDPHLSPKEQFHAKTIGWKARQVELPFTPEYSLAQD